jgi:predicted SnoaL-like aldol condensation-catalyzing enzyme
MLAASALSLTGCSSADEPAPAASEASDHAAQTEATRKVALEFLQTYFIDRDLGAYAKFADPDFTQHNPLMGDGVAAHRAYMDKIFGAAKPAGAPAQAHVIDLVLVDGDLFSVMHHAVNPDGTGRIFVDLWRVADGKIAEHWDVIQDMPLDNAMPHKNGMGCGFQTYDAAKARPDSVTAPTCGTPDAKVTREQSLANYSDYVAEVGKGDVVSAIETWFHPAYKQHSPIIADGKQGAIDYLMAEWGKKDAPKPILGEQRIVAEGDFVLVHYMYKLEGVPGQEAHIDIFRFKDGKISEHWDVKQKVPATSANKNGMW